MGLVLGECGGGVSGVGGVCNSGVGRVWGRGESGSMVAEV